MSDTQATPEDMPKVPHTVVIKGTYRFNARYPTNLVNEGLVSKNLVRESLFTKDWREAKPMAARRYVLHLAEIERLTEQLAGEPDLNDRAKQEQIHLSSFSKSQKRNLVLKWFVEMEQRATRTRENYQDFDEEEQTHIFDIAKTELTSYEGSKIYQSIDLEADVKSFLEQTNIAFEPVDITEDFLLLYKKAVIEVHWRNVESYDGNQYAQRDPVFKKLHAQSQIEKKVQKTRTVGELCDEYMEAKIASGRSPATLKSYNTPFNVLKERLGTNTNLASLDESNGGDTYETGKKIVSFLTKIPPNAKKHYQGLSLTKASKIEAKKATPNFISPKTQRGLFTDMKAILAFAIKRHWLKANPLNGLEDSLPAIIERPRIAINGVELTTLLSSPDFLKEKTRIINGKKAEGRFWCVILCLFHGMRVNEAASLLVTDIREEDGIWIFDLTEFDDQGNIVKRLKNKASRRRIPIHSEAINIGFMKFLENRKATGGEAWLFPDIKPNSIGNRGDSTSRWFSKLRDKHVGKQMRQGDKSLHTLRGLVADAIRAITESDEILFSIGGWESNQRGNSSRRYGKGNLQRLKRVIDQVAFEDFNPSFLYPESEPE